MNSGENQARGVYRFLDWFVPIGISAVFALGVWLATSISDAKEHFIRVDMTMQAISNTSAAQTTIMEKYGMKLDAINPGATEQSLREIRDRINTMEARTETNEREIYKLNLIVPPKEPSK